MTLTLFTTLINPRIYSCWSIKNKLKRNSLVVQWFGLSAPTAGGVGSIGGKEKKAKGTLVCF